MTKTPARPKTLDTLKDAFLRNAIDADVRGCDLRETVLVHEADRDSGAAPGLTNETKPAESRA